MKTMKITNMLLREVTDDEILNFIHGIGKLMGHVIRFEVYRDKENFFAIGGYPRVTVEIQIAEGVVIVEDTQTEKLK